MAGTALPVIPKPEFGAACNGCGQCCSQEVCQIGIEAMGGPVAAPCPFLRFHDARFWCGVVEEADKVNVAFGAHLRLQLAVGFGCDSE